MVTIMAIHSPAAADTLLDPDPSPALQGAYETIRRTRMAGIPLLNQAVHVEAVGFRRWQGFWLGVLITPWCMNLVLTAADPAHWPRLRTGEKWTCRFPAGAFEFVFGREAFLGEDRSGETLMCSLFSPMFEFANHEGARATALACLQALFDEHNEEAADIALGPAPVTLAREAAAAAERVDRDGATAPGAASMSKREFLRGRWSAPERTADAPTDER